MPTIDLRPAWIAGLALAALAALVATAPAQQQNYKQTGARSIYRHHIDVYDAEGRKIDPTAAGAAPYSPTETCKKCHDVDAIHRGWHFNAATGDAHGRAGEPWIWHDPRTGTELPLSYRGTPGTFAPDAVGLDPVGFAARFGRHLPGGLSSYAGGDPSADRRRVVGELAIDCMACHDAGGQWRHERWAEQVEQQNFAWAPSVALGLAKVEGSAQRLPDDLDPSTDDGRAKLPKVTWDTRRVDLDKQVFFDVVRTPTAESCYACHTVRPVGESEGPRWVHDGDVHLQAGMSCSDCHRNGIEHHTVRGYPGETHPAGFAVDSLSCRGCHLDASDGNGRVTARGGRLGAPRPEHAGLPPLHLEKMSCTSCHSGAWPRDAARRVQTSMAHALGLPSQTRSDADAPRIIEPVLRRDEDGVIRPYRAFWPTFWARVEGDAVAPIAPDDALQVVRRTFRVRRDLVAEVADLEPAALHAKVATALEAFGADAGLIAGGELWTRAADGSLARREHPAAAAVHWPLAHDVRPARRSAGVGGCTDCHAPDAPFLYQTAGPASFVHATAPEPVAAWQSMELEPGLLTDWERMFAGRDAFKIVGLAAVGLLALLLVVFAALGVDGVAKLLRGRRRGEAS